MNATAFVQTNRHKKRDHQRMELSPQAQWRYVQLCRGELNDVSRRSFKYPESTQKYGVPANPIVCCLGNPFGVT
jgi:hypothetical protein